MEVRARRRRVAKKRREKEGGEGRAREIEEEDIFGTGL